METNYRKNKTCYYCEQFDILEFDCYKMTEDEITYFKFKNKGLVIPSPKMFNFMLSFPKFEKKYLEWQIKKSLSIKYPVKENFND